MRKPAPTVIAAALATALGAPAFAAEPDWGKVPAKSLTLFYPGAAPIEWIQKGTEHGGARGMKKGEACAGCHGDEVADMGKKMASGQKLEPTPIKGKAPSIPVSVQAANDGTNLYLRFSWKQPASAGAKKQDEQNQVKLALMVSENNIEGIPTGGCWATCHEDSRTMPGAKDDKKTKYVAGGKVFDLMQWKSAKGAKPADGKVAAQRTMEGGKALVSANGTQAGDTWTVTFARKLGAGDVALAAGKSYNFGFAIHDDWTHGRFHHVSLGYTLGIDAKADITAAKQ